MKILIDECAPKALKRSLRDHGHEGTTVQEAGWSGKQNGELLALADSHYDVLITLDTNLRYQQNLAERKIAVIVIQARSNRLDDLRIHFTACVAALESIEPGDIVFIGVAT
jgi:predicted nuclease of predicted toxin-antitoxin system